MSLLKKCITASAVAHGLLLLLVFVGSAFIPQQSPPVEGPVFELFTMPDEIVEDPSQFSGGNPNVTEPPAPAPVSPPVQQPVVQQPTPDPPVVTPPVRTPEPPPQPQPQVQVREQTTPEPVTPERAEPEPKEVEPNPFDLSKARQNRPEPQRVEQPKPSNKFDFSKVEKRKITPAETRSNNQRNSEPAPQTGQIAKNLSESLNRVRGNLSSVGGSYDIPGPGGPTRASYTAYLAYEYRRAWVAPSKSTSRAPVDVEVVIARDGTVLSYKIRPSGNRQADAAAEATMKRIRRFEKAPPGNQPQVTYRFTFTPEE